MTLYNTGYVLEAGASLENLDMGGGSVLALRVTGAESDGRVTVIEGVVHRGGPPLHVHDEEDEVVVVTEGRLAYLVGDQAGEIGPGGLLWMPRRVPHAIAQAGLEPCRFVTIVTPAGIEDFFRAQRDYLASLPTDAAPEPADLAAVDGAGSRPVVGLPLS
jgi:quercetin dioxygenase-like cupin family protein